MKAICFSCFAAIVALAGCGAGGGGDVCVGPDGIAVFESLAVGSLASTDAPDDLVAWNDGDEVEMEYGSQGFLMLVVSGVVRGQDLHREPPEIEMTLARENGFVISMSGIFGGASDQDPQGTWYATEIYLPFEDFSPADGEVLTLRASTPCHEIVRSLVMRRPL